jgi:Ca2+-transporting ATPase
MPVQIAFLELIIDPACSIAFEAEPIDPETMNRPPRGLGEPMFGWRILTIATLQGISVLAAVFGVYLWSIMSHRSDDVVRALTFTTLVVGNLALILVNRSWRLNMVQALIERKNRTIGWILGFAGLFLVLLLTIPALRELFRFGPIHASDVPVVLVAGFVGVLWFEIYKFIVSRCARTNVPPKL